MEHILEISRLSKKFRSNYALKDITLSLGEGEILGLVGANGSGKTTLMNILAGNPVIAETGGFSGEIKFNGKNIFPETPADSLRLGIGMVYQEFALIPSFTATENVMLGRENRISLIPGLGKFRMPIVDRRADMLQTESILSGFGMNDLDLNAHVTEFSVGTRQFIEFARVINRENIKLLILDEPTAVLGREESARLMEKVRSMAVSGVSAIFISHRIDEALSLCSRIAVLRDGALVSLFNTAETSAQEIACSMLGSLQTMAGKSHSNTASQDGGESFFRIRSMGASSGGELLKDFSLDVNKGEIFGITGQSGQGQMLIGKSIMGLIPSEGELIIGGRKIAPGDTDALYNAGVYYIPEERRRDGLLPEHSVAANITFTLISTKRSFTSRSGILHFREIDETAQRYIKDLNIKCTGTKQKVCELSGGNQQKVILSRALSLKPEILMVFEPTRGIDIGAKEMILGMLINMNKEMKTTIIIVSSELEELVRVCDRVAVLYEGSTFSVMTPDLSAEKFALAFAGRER